METLKKDVKLVSPILRDIFCKLVSDNSYQSRFYEIVNFALTTKETFKAFILVHTGVTEARTRYGNESCIELSLYPSDTITISNKYIDLPNCFIKLSYARIQKLTVECAPLWMHSWLRTFINHGCLRELKIGHSVGDDSLPILAEIAETTKILFDKSGKVGSMLNRGQFEFVDIRHLVFPTHSLFSNMNFTTDGLKCVIYQYDWCNLKDVLPNSLNLAKDKLSSIKYLHIVVITWTKCDLIFQPFVDLLMKIMPNVKSILVNIILTTIDFYGTIEQIPNTFEQYYDSFQRLILPSNNEVNIKLLCEHKWLMQFDELESLVSRLIAFRQMKKVPIKKLKKDPFPLVFGSFIYAQKDIQKWVFDAGNELGSQKEFIIELLIYVIDM